MDILSFAREIFEGEKIEYVSALPLSSCEIVRPYLLQRAGIGDEGTVIMLAVPYFAADSEARNLSLYAVSGDYHLYFSELFGRVLPQFREKFFGHIFEGFSDHSPIAEIGAAAMSGIGVIGKNHMLITEKYSSYVFLGEIICDIKADIPTGKIKECEMCGACERACPVGLDMDKCLSALSQKKGSLSLEEEEKLISLGSVWGCDICQSVCPHSAEASETKIEFFHQKRLPFIKTDTIENMSEEDFSSRAYSWRGKDVILRNLKIFGSGNER